MIGPFPLSELLGIVLNDDPVQSCVINELTVRFLFAALKEMLKGSFIFY